MVSAIKKNSQIVVFTILYVMLIEMISKYINNNADILIMHNNIFNFMFVCGLLSFAIVKFIRNADDIDDTQCESENDNNDGIKMSVIKYGGILLMFTSVVKYWEILPELKKILLVFGYIVYNII
jgi:hypothetical protein